MSSAYFNQKSFFHRPAPPLSSSPPPAWNRRLGVVSNRLPVSFKKEVERLVGEINGEHATLGWTPVQYLYRGLSREELVAKYRLADIALITPLRDGMNLVAKEYCACKNSLRGVLILSEFAGAAAQLKDEALVVNPYDIHNVAQAIRQACSMPLQERRQRMLAARKKIHDQDITWWLNCFLQAALDRDQSGPGQSPWFDFGHLSLNLADGHDLREIQRG